jgi:GTP-binding protein
VSVIVARRAIEKADVAVLVIDPVEGATDQDATIAGEADKAGCGIVIAANKWDLMKGRGPTSRRSSTTSCGTGEVPRVRAGAAHLGGDRRADRQGAGDDRQGRRSTDAPHPDIGAEPLRRRGDRRPSAGQPGRREVRILYAAQTGVAPPTFVFFTNVATEFHFSYERFLVNRLRESFGLIGTPIRIHVRRREKKEH